MAWNDKNQPPPLDKVIDDTLLKFKSKFSQGGNMKGTQTNKSIFGAVAGLVIAITIFNSAHIIETGNVGVKSTMGQIDRQELSPGLNFALPIISKIENVFTKTIMVNYTPDQKKDTQEVYYERSLKGEDRTGLEMGIDLIVEVNPISDKMSDMYIEVGREGLLKKVLQPIRGASRKVLGQYNAESVMSKRKELEDGIEKELTRIFAKNPYYEMVNLQLKKIYLPIRVQEAIERVQLAKQDASSKKEQIVANKALAQSKIELAKGEAQAVRERAQASADSVLIKAKANAEANIIESQAQAKANLIISTSLTSALIQQNTVEAWKSGGAQVPKFVGSDSQFIFDLNNKKK
jgi:regulator of protease activity HflC (stomatin/prohibitin superfamily)